MILQPNQLKKCSLFLGFLAITFKSSTNLCMLFMADVGAPKGKRVEPSVKFILEKLSDIKRFSCHVNLNLCHLVVFSFFFFFLIVVYQGHWTYL